VGALIVDRGGEKVYLYVTLILVCNLSLIRHNAMLGRCLLGLAIFYWHSILQC